MSEIIRRLRFAAKHIEEHGLKTEGGIKALTDLMYTSANKLEELYAITNPDYFWPGEKNEPKEQETANPEKEEGLEGIRQAPDGYNESEEAYRREYEEDPRPGDST